MSDEHGWAHFDPDDGGDDGFAIHHDPDPAADDPGHLEHDAGYDDAYELPEHDLTPVEHHDPGAWEEPAPEPEIHHDIVDVTGAHSLGPVGADPDATADPDAGETVFPPLVDVGALPEPVDGWPWIDTGSLGTVTPIDAAPAPVAAHELAEYAAEELPPAADPWAALTQSEDPAAAALARWWHPEA
ncbi:hypothetical protein [Symbioplanes lichenis]|uniref:hypothetical protein n=1 Tax=Symbioplanes lichenis TaxID=1629072 RepID=UPI0027399732|nr:hypothetical protein [Actinoplanes lichenis]